MSQSEKIAVFGLLVQNGQILIVKRTKKEVGKNEVILTWGFPGGKVERNESMENAVVREFYEETGFNVLTERLISERIHPDFPVRALYFSCRSISDKPDDVDDLGTQEVRWVKISDLASYFTSELDPGVSGYLSNKGF